MFKTAHTLSLLALVTLLAGCELSLSSSSDEPEVTGDASLASLVVTDLATDEVLELTPAFDSEVTEYTATVDGNHLLHIAGTTTEPIFAVRVNGNSPDFPDEYTFESSDDHQIVAPEEIAVGVTAQDGQTTRTYIIQVESSAG